jgi:hypothetical protein
MPSMSNYPNGFSNGVTIRGMPITIAYPGKVFFLGNGSVVSAPNGKGGSDSNKGTYEQPFSTLAGALSNCVASRGDIIMVLPGHAETVSSASALTLSKAGVAIIGMGAGNLRPTFTLGTANTATINVTAAQVAISNCLFKANFAAIASLFTLTTAKDFTLADCEFRDNSSILNFAKIVDTNTTSNDADGLSIERCQFYGLGATSNTALIKMDGTNDRVSVIDCYVAHAATTAAGLMPIAAGKVVTNFVCSRNTFNLVGATDVTTGILITTDGSTNSGMISRNLVQSLDATSEILVTASSGFRYSQNYYSGTADASGYLLPAADS